MYPCHTEIIVVLLNLNLSKLHLEKQQFQYPSLLIYRCNALKRQ